MLKRYVRGINFILRYSFRAHGNPVVIELPTVKQLAKHIPGPGLLTPDSSNGFFQFFRLIMREQSFEHRQNIAIHKI
jgi:hypothetical protein